MLNFFRKFIAPAILFSLAFAILTSLPLNIVHAGVCGDLIVLKNGVAVKESGTVNITATDKSKWELKIITARSRTTCADDWVRVTLQSTDASNVKSAEETIIAAQLITGGKDINKTIPLKISEGKHTYTMDSSKDNTFAQRVSNFLSITSARTDTNTTTTKPTNNPQPSAPVDIPAINSPFKNKTLSGIISQGITILLTLIMAAAVVVIIVGGFRLAVGGGNPDQIAKGKKTIIWAIVGLTVAFMSFAIVKIIQNLL